MTKKLILSIVAALLLSATGCSTTPAVKPPVNTVKLNTTMGEILIKLDLENAPVTTENFLKYVEDGFYDGAIFHRVIPNFMIQGGGFTPDMAKKPTNDPIINEGSNGLKNIRGSIAMARTPNPNSATSQFYINLKNNVALDYIQGQKPGYAVFGTVIEGMDTVDAIAAQRTTTKNGMRDVPAKTIIIESAEAIRTK